MAYKRITVSLTEDRYERLNDLCDEMGMSMSQAVNWVMTQWDAMLSTKESGGYEKYWELRGQIEHLEKRYAAASERAGEREQECIEAGNRWGEGQYNGQAFAYSMASTDMLLLLAHGLTVTADV